MSTRGKVILIVIAALLAGCVGANVEKAPSHESITLPKVSRFTGKTISLSLDNAPVREIIYQIAALAQINIIVGPDVTGTMSVNFKETPWGQIIETVLIENDLEKYVEVGVIHIRRVEWIRENIREEIRPILSGPAI